LGKFSNIGHFICKIKCEIKGFLKIYLFAILFFSLFQWQPNLPSLLQLAAIVMEFRFFELLWLVNFI